MSKLFASLALITGLALGGCTTQAQFLQSMQMNAMQTAVSRGQFEMNCPSATPTLISQEVIQPALQGPFVNGIQRAEYTIGVAGLWAAQDFRRHLSGRRIGLFCGRPGAVPQLVTVVSEQ